MNEENNLLPEGENNESEDLYLKQEFTVDQGQSPLRIDKFLQARIEGATRNKVQQSLHAGLITVDGQTVKPNFKVKGGQHLVIFRTTEPESSEILPEKMDLDIVFEDDSVIVINKPAGMVVHPGVGNRSGTLINGIAHHLQQQNPQLSEFDLPRFGLVHRIDKNTSGLILLAKTDKALQHLARQFFDHTITRRYIALVWGNVEEDEGTINAHIGRSKRFRQQYEAYPEGDEGKHAITHYQVLERFHYTTLIACQLETGRTHQIRVHMKSIGHTIFADEFYGGDRILKGTVFAKYKQFVDNCFALCPRQALHAGTLGFTHPVTGERMQFEAGLPSDLRALVDKWRRYFATKGGIEE